MEECVINVCNTSTNWISTALTIFAAVLGAAVGGFFTLLSANDSHKKQLQLEEEKAKLEIQGVVQAIHCEINTLKERYLSNIAPSIERVEDDQPLMTFFPLNSDYFTIYNGNSSSIGHIPDSALRGQIVKTYTLSKAMIDSLNMNNSLLQKYEHMVEYAAQAKMRVDTQPYLYQLVGYASTLKSSHQELVENMDELEKMLNEYLSEKK